MAQFPALPIWTDSILGDTQHLDTEQFGAYCLMLFVAWRSPDNALPVDDAKLARICRLSPAKWRRSRDTLLAFWTVIDEKYHQKKLDKVKNSVNEISEKRRKAREAKLLKDKEASSTNVDTNVVTKLQQNDSIQNQNQNQIQNQNQTLKKEAKLSLAEEASPNEIIHAFDKAITKTWGISYQRLCPTATDRTTAEYWIEAGMTVDFCKAFFEEQLSGIKKRDKPPPTALKFFSSTIGKAFGEWKKANESTLTEEQKREAYFLEKGKWLPIWGEMPEHLKKEACYG